MKNIAGVPARTRTRRRRAVLLLVSLLPTPWALWAADVTVPSLELATRGNPVSGLVTKGQMTMLVEGGVKLGGSVTLALDGAQLEQSVPSAEIFDPAITPVPGAVASLNFLAAAIRLREAFGSALSLEFFVGEHDSFATGDDFTEVFGAPQLATRYRGFFTFTAPPFYDGLHKINGTGLSFDVSLGTTGLLSSYIYQDSRIMDATGTLLPGHYSADVRMLLNWEKLKLELFVGGTYPGSEFGTYRTGLLFHASEGIVEFFAQIGVPRWDPATDPFDLSMFYLLFEPRVTFGAFKIVPTFFWRPAFYLQMATGNTQTLDVNLAFLLGDELVSPVSGGLESTLQFDAAATSQIQVKVSPFISFITPGVLWQIKPEFTVVPFDLTNLVTFVVGLNAEL